MDNYLKISSSEEGKSSFVVESQNKTLADEHLEEANMSPELARVEKKVSPCLQILYHRKHCSKTNCSERKIDRFEKAWDNLSLWAVKKLNELIERDD